MKNGSFDAAYNYVHEVISLVPEMMERKLGIESLAALMALSRSSMETLMEGMTVVDLDGKDFDVFTDRVDDPEFVLPDELAIEMIRRVRKARVLAGEEMRSRVQEGKFEDFSDVLESILMSGEEVLSDRLVLAERLMLVYDDHHKNEMEEFGQALSQPLQMGVAAVESVLESLDDDEDNDEPLTEEEEMIVHHAYELLDEYYRRIDSFLKKYPNMSEHFCDRECDNCVFNGMRDYDEE